jgi:hypothetical protein
VASAAFARIKAEVLELVSRFSSSTPASLTPVVMARR